MDILVPRKMINPERLAAEMTAAIGSDWQGWSARKADPDNFTLHVPEGTPQATIDTVLAVYAAHDPAQLTAEQLRAQKAQAALAQLGAADYQAWLTGVQGITTLAQAKTRLEQLGRVVWLLLQAQGINELP